MRALILLCLVSLVSCSAFRPGAIELTFWDQKTLKPVPNIPVEFKEHDYQADMNDLFYPGNSETRNALTDENGKIIFDNVELTRWIINGVIDGRSFSFPLSFRGNFDKGDIWLSNNSLHSSNRIGLIYPSDEESANPTPRYLMEIKTRWTDGTWHSPYYYPDCGGGGGYK